MIEKIKKSFSYLEIPDFTNQIFLLVLTIIVVINYRSFESWYMIVIVNIIINIATIYFIQRYEAKSGENKEKSFVSKVIRFWYPVFMILLFFKEIYLIMINLKPVFYDDILIQIDKAVFGVNPTQFLFGFANPFVTEFLQIIYIIFYLMPAIFGLELFLWKRYDEYKYCTFLIFFGFYLSFIGYMILPAIGPRFTLHIFHNLENDLPGIFMTDFLRAIINFGESIPKDMLNPEKVAQRDAFPSGHTEIMVIITYVSRKFKSKSFYFYLPYTILLIASTIYLRYHYVVDVVAGIIFAIITIVTANWIYSINRNKIKSTEQ